MVTEEQIKKLASSIWQQEGRHEGKHVEHHYRAKQILQYQEPAHVIELGPPRPYRYEEQDWSTQARMETVRATGPVAGNGEPD